MRDVQRNDVHHDDNLADDVFLFAVVRDVQRNGNTRWEGRDEQKGFLFAVVRDVQRNVADESWFYQPGFYSLSCETYSGTSRSSSSSTVPPGRPFLFAVVRDVQRNPSRIVGKTPQG